MSEYMEKHSVSLVGAPPGYVGYEEGGQLSEAIRRRPTQSCSDEVERRTRMCSTFFALDDGGLLIPKRTVDFRNTVIVMTSNIGSIFSMCLVTIQNMKMRLRVLEALHRTSARNSQPR